MKRLFSILLLFIQLTFSYAQEESLLGQLNAKDLDTIVKPAVLNLISASRSLKPISELPVNSYIITKETIEKNNYRTLTDVLRDIPGYRVSSPGDAKIGESFSINGLLGNYYTKILINGIPVNLSLAPGMPIGKQLPISQAERIEVISDPSSAIYGADAMGGVINIITDQSQKRASFGKAQISAGSFGMNEVNLLLGGQLGKNKNIFKYSLYANHSQSKDFNNKSSYGNLYNLNNYLQVDTVGLGNNPYFSGTPDKPYLGNLPSSNLMYGINLEYQNLKFSLFHFERKDHSAIGKLPFYSSYEIPNTFWGESITQATLTHNLSRSNFHSQTNLSFQSYRINNGSSELRVNSPIGEESGLKFVYGAADEVNLDQLFNFKINQKANVSLGANFNYAGNLPIYQNLSAPFKESVYKPFSESIELVNSDYYILSNEDLRFLRYKYGDSYTDLKPYNFYQIGAFGQYDYSSEIVSLLLDLRIDYNSIYGSYFSPKISSRFNLTENLSARASASRSYKSPSAYYKYSSKAKIEGEENYILFPNSNLKYEKLNAFELALRYKFAKANQFELISNYFMRSDEIIFSFSNPDLAAIGVNPGNYYGYVNNTDNGSRNFMLQANLKLRNLLESVKLDVDLSLSYQNREETTNEQLLRYDTYRIQPAFLFQGAFKMKLLRNIDFITRVYGNSTYNNAYYEFFKDVFPDGEINTALLDQKNGGIWTDMSLYYTRNEIISVFFKVRNVFNSQYSGIQTADPLTGLYNNPQNGRFLEIGMTFKMY